MLEKTKIKWLQFDKKSNVTGTRTIHKKKKIQNCIYLTLAHFKPIYHSALKQLRKMLCFYFHLMRTKWGNFNEVRSH